jgi:hypothetical protein
MLNCDPDSKHHSPSWIFFWKIVEIICLVSVLVFVFTHGSFVGRLQREYPTMALLFLWLLGMLSYHQDAKGHDPWWAVLSQTLSIVCVVAIVVFGFTQRLWLNLLIAPPLAWLHIQFTKRWWARPGTWW